MSRSSVGDIQFERPADIRSNEPRLAVDLDYANGVGEVIPQIILGGTRRFSLSSALEISEFSSLGAHPSKSILGTFAISFASPGSSAWLRP